MSRLNRIWAALGVALICVIAGGCGKGSGDAATDETSIAQAYVSAFYSGDTATMDKLETDTLKQGFTKDKLAGYMQQIKPAMGEFKSKGATRTGKVAGYDVVYVTCTFEKGVRESKVVFDTAHKVSGFFLIEPGGQ